MGGTSIGHSRFPIDDRIPGSLSPQQTFFCNTLIERRNRLKMNTKDIGAFRFKDYENICSCNSNSMQTIVRLLDMEAFKGKDILAEGRIVDIRRKIPITRRTGGSR